MTTPEIKIADALRVVALRLENALEEGRRSARVDAHDLLEMLLAVADELDPPVANSIATEAACPHRGERRVDELLGQADEETVRCAGCGMTYRPGL